MKLRDEIQDLEHKHQRAPVGVCLFDSEVRIAHLDRRFARVSGKPMDFHLGRRIAEVIPELAPAMEPALRRVMETGEPVVDLEIDEVTPVVPGGKAECKVWRQWCRK